MTKTTDTPKTGIERAVERAGNQVKLAQRIGTSQQMVSYWVNKGIVSDAGMCAAIERAYGIPCEELNPKEDWATLRAVLCAPGRASGGNKRKTKEARAV